ncbi:MAG: DUF1707 domain-containing protein [Nakamurella sp.]
MTNSRGQFSTGDDAHLEPTQAVQPGGTQPHEHSAGVSAGDAIALGAMRVGDTERTSALEALAEHLTAGRITLDEYGDRTVNVTIARTADDLLHLFDDLPAPHPTMPGSAQHSTGLVAPTATKYPAQQTAFGSKAVSADGRSRAQIIVAAAASASVFIALALFFLTGTWLWFLLIPAVSGIAKAVWGDEWTGRQRRSSRRRELGGGSAKD